MDGVVRTQVGYAGGTTPQPTYHRIGDHTEVVQVAFDPGRVTYEELLRVFWGAHDPTRSEPSRQYRSVILTSGPDQERLALDSKRRAEEAAAAGAGGRKVRTAVEPLDVFYPAEDYHQKYFLQQVPELMRALKARHGSGSARVILDSTEAARLNGYVCGYGDPEQLRMVIDDFALEPDARQYLLNLVSARRGPRC